MKVEAIKPCIGARVYVDPADICNEDVVKRSLELLEERGVLVFPKIGLTDEQQLAFTDALGTRVTYTGALPGSEKGSDIYKVTLDPKINTRPEIVQGTFFWHMDGITEDMAPPKATFLSARRIAPKGGQTEFASTYAAYEGLPADDKEEYAALRVVHKAATAVRDVVEEAAFAEVEKMTRGHVREHPLVWTHKSGRKSLLIGSHADHVVSLPRPDGRALLARLLEWTGQPDYSYRHYWSEGDLVVWDNCGALHRVVPYDKKSGRMMHRTTIAGTEEVR